MPSVLAATTSPIEAAVVLTTEHSTDPDTQHAAVEPAHAAAE